MHRFSSYTAGRDMRAAVWCCVRPMMPLAAGLLVAGCVTVVEPVEPLGAGTRTGARTGTTPGTGAEGPIGRGNAAERAAAARIRGESFNSHVVAAVQSRGTIPYDKFTLPLVSPDGRYIATQAGLDPGWPVILAEPGARVSRWTHIDIYELPVVGNSPPFLVGSVNQAGILGRSSDGKGFLIESPQNDGSRWIGRAAWTTGVVTWLVNDPGSISAFASLGPGGRLAWSSRSVSGGPFDMIVRHQGREWRLPGNEGSWLMPTWSGGSNGDGLFVLLLRGDALDAVHMVAASAHRANRSMQRVPLALRGADVGIAHQTLAGHAVTVFARTPQRELLPMVHPTSLRAAVWVPPARPFVLDKGSFAALPDITDDRFVLMSTARPDPRDRGGGDLVRRNLANERVHSKLIAGRHVVRATDSVDRPYILLQPDPNNGVVGVTVMKLLPSE